MTPVVIVSGYFSIEEKIFGFSKNAKSFTSSVAIVGFVLYVLNMMVYVVRHHLGKGGRITRMLTGQFDQLLLDVRENGKCFP